MPWFIASTNAETTATMIIERRAPKTMGEKRAGMRMLVLQCGVGEAVSTCSDFEQCCGAYATSPISRALA